MDQGESGSGLIIPTKETQTPLISGLPDDIAFLCLARVPRRYHAVLNCVSRKWRDLVGSDEFYSYRMKHNLHETQIFALCRDKQDRLSLYMFDPNSSRRSWKRIDELPPRVLKRNGLGFEVLGKKVYVLGGCGWTEDATDAAYSFDASSNSWLEISPMSQARCYFACEVMDGKIYALGGVGLNSNISQSWDICDPSADSWEFHLHSDPKIFSESRDSFVMNGKIYIRDDWSVRSVFINESLGSTLLEMEKDMATGWHGPAVVVDGDLYVLDETSGTTLTMWCKKSEKWVRVGRLSPLVTRPPSRLVSVGKKIFVIGKGFSTVVIDVESSRNVVDGVMLCSSIPSIPDAEIEVISCKCLTA